MNKLLFSLVGATLMLGSAVVLIDCMASKKRSRGLTAAKAVAGIAGLVTGTVIALQPEKARHDATEVTDMLTEEDEGILHKHIAEVLGDGVDRGKNATHVREIELDNDTTIDDFIFG